MMKMKKEVYAIIILGWPAEGPNDAAAPRCYAQSFEEAMSIARPWVEQGHDVVITTKQYKENEVTD